MTLSRLGDAEAFHNSITLSMASFPQMTLNESDLLTADSLNSTAQID
jgi:hypothetical protein